MLRTRNLKLANIHDHPIIDIIDIIAPIVINIRNPNNNNTNVGTSA